MKDLKIFSVYLKCTGIGSIHDEINFNKDIGK